MIKDKQDVNKLIATLESAYPNGVPADKREAVESFIRAQFRSRPVDPNWADQFRLSFNCASLKEYAEEQQSKYPHLNPDLYDSPVEYSFAIYLHYFGFVWQPRHCIGKYRLDFAFTTEKVDVEVDGVLYHGLPHQQRKDEIRDAYLNRQGWVVLRISAHDAQYKRWEVMDRVRNLLTIRQRKIHINTKH